MKLHLVSLAHHPDTRERFRGEFQENFAYPDGQDTMVVTLALPDAQEAGDGIIVSRHWAGEVIAVSDTMNNIYTLQGRWIATNIRACAAGVNRVTLTLRKWPDASHGTTSRSHAEP